MKNKNKYLYILLLILSLNLNNNAFAQTTTIEKPAPILGGMIKWGALAGGVGLGIAGHKLHKYNSVIDLLDNREQVLRLIQGNPGYKNDVLKRLNNALNKDSELYSLEQHQQILDLYNQVNNSTEILIPEQINNSTETVENNDNKQENEELIIEDNDNLNHNSTIKPNQNNQQNNSTQTPNEKNPLLENILVFSNSVKLSNSMYKAGMGKKPAFWAAHHIFPYNAVSSGLIEAIRAKAILDKYGINLNDAVNGVYLPTPKATGNNQGIFHNGSHPHNYILAVSLRIIDGDSKGKNGVINELNKMRNELSTANNNANWNTIIQ